MKKANKKLMIHAAVISHKGCERDNNEDNFFFNGDIMPLKKMDEGAFVKADFSDQCQLYAICDGMGGADMGERAAFLSCWHLFTLSEKMNAEKMPEMIETYAEEASDIVFADGQKNRVGLSGTTMAMAALIRKTVWVANVGDSRVYRFRDGELEQVSFDHSEVNRLCQEGLMTEEEARKSPRNNIITHYIGMEKTARPADFVYKSRHTLKKDDRWMLCSDGLCDLLPKWEIARLIKEAETAEDAAKKLVCAALEMGGKDNVTVMVFDVKMC